jgi:Flp pilus assembly secretin CpaC
LGREYGATIVVSELAQSRQVTIDVKEISLLDLLRLVGRRSALPVSYRGGVYYLGDLRPEDRAVLVRRVYRLDGEQLARVLTLVRGDSVPVALEDGSLIMADSVGAIQSACDMLDRCESLDVPQWCVQLHLIAVNERQSRELGLDVTPAIDVSASLASGVGSAFAGKAVLSALLKASSECGAATVDAQPLLFIEEGSKARFMRGLNIPVPQRTVSDQGTVTTSGFTQVRTGLTITASVRECALNRARLTLNLVSNDRVGEVEGAPITEGVEWEGSATVESGGCYLLGEVNRGVNERALNGPFKLRETFRHESSTLQIWAQVVRVGALWVIWRGLRRNSRLTQVNWRIRNRHQ